MRDPYSILGVSRHADQQEIKAAWRATAKALHPDQNPNDPAAASRFTEAGRAYDLLKDPNKRKLFDDARARAEATRNGDSGRASDTARGGKEKTFMEQRAERARAEAEKRAAAEARARAEARAAAAAAAAKPQPKDDPGASETKHEAEDVVAKIFGTKKPNEGKAEPRESAPPPPPPQEPKASSKPVDEPSPATERAAEHHTQTHEPRPSPALELINYVIKRLTRPAQAPEKAPDLMIEVWVSLDDILKRLNPAITLPDGKLLSITIPDDAKDGTQIRIEGYGHRLPHIKRGDVVATLRIKPHTWYRHYGYDLLTHVDIDIENAVLGCEATVETLDGPVKVTVPPWSGSNYKATIPGRGLPKGNGQRGDMIAEVRVMLWDRPDQKIIDLMRSMREGLYL